MDAVATTKVDEAALPPKERVLLHYVETLTLRPADVTDAMTQDLRNAGWKDEEIFEAAFITSLFAFFNRMADAYGLDYAPGGWRPSSPASPSVSAARTPLPAAKMNGK